MRLSWGHRHRRSTRGRKGVRSAGARDPRASPAVQATGGVGFGRRMHGDVAAGLTGRGGRCAEFLLSLRSSSMACPVFMRLPADTDGIDGTEDNAGAWFRRMCDAGCHARSVGAECIGSTRFVRLFPGRGRLDHYGADADQRQRLPGHPGSLNSRSKVRQRERNLAAMAFTYLGCEIPCSRHSSASNAADAIDRRSTLKNSRSAARVSERPNPSVPSVT